MYIYEECITFRNELLTWLEFLSHKTQASQSMFPYKVLPLCWQGASIVAYSLIPTISSYAGTPTLMFGILITQDDVQQFLCFCPSHTWQGPIPINRTRHFKSLQETVFQNIRLKVQSLKKLLYVSLTFSIVAQVGLEPTPPCGEQILSLPRIPIPPLSQVYCFC